MRVRYENWVDGLNGDWLVSAASASSACRSRSGTRSTPTGSPDHDDADPRRRGHPARSTRSPTCPPGLRRSPSATSPAASPATPTSWTPGPPRRSPRRSPPAGARTPTCSPAPSRWTCAPRPTRSSAPGCSPPSCAPTSSTTRCRGPTPPSRAGSSTPTARRCRSRRATSSRPLDLLEQYGSDAVRYWAASGRPGTDTAFDEGQMKVGRRLAIKMLNASRFALGLGGGDGQPRSTTRRSSPSRSTGRCWPTWPTWSTRPPRAFDGYDYARALERTEAFFWRFCDHYLELVKGRAYGRPGRRGGAARPRPPCSSPSPPCCACSPRSCPSSPRRCGRGGRTARCTPRRGPTPSVLRDAAADGDPLAFAAGGRGPRRGPPGQDRGQALAAVAGRPRVVVRDSEPRLKALEPVSSRTCGRRPTPAEIVVEVGAEASITVELAPSPTSQLSAPARRDPDGPVAQPLPSPRSSRAGHLEGVAGDGALARLGRARDVGPAGSAGSGAAAPPGPRTRVGGSGRRR